MANSSPNCPQMVSANPEIVKYQFSQNPLGHYLIVNDHFCTAFRAVRSAQQAETTQLVQASIGSPKHSGRSASGWTTPTYGAPRVPCPQRRITNPTSDQTPDLGSAPHPHPHRHRHRSPTYHARLPLSGLPSGQTHYQGLPLLLLEQSAAVHSPPPVVSARVRVPVQLLAHQPRLHTLTHHWIRRTPSDRRRTYTAARLNLQLLPARVPVTPAALLIIKAQSETPAAGPAPQ